MQLPVQKQQKKQLRQNKRFMKEILTFSHVRGDICRSDVLNVMECYENSPVYEEVVKEYESIKKEMEDMLQPQAVFAFGAAPENQTVNKKIPTGTPVVYSILTVGGKLSAYSTEMFRQDEYVKGMLADSLASAYLFAMEKEAFFLLKQECAVRHWGISNRLEIPADLPMETQMVIFCECQAERTLGMKISTGYMFDPVKSNGMIFELSKEESLFRTQHDCSKCTAKNCKMRGL